MPAMSLERARGELGRLSHRGLGVRDFSLAAARVLRPVVPFDGMCVVTMDPATLLVTGHVIENGLPEEATPRLAELEVLEPDFNKFAELARAASPAASLSEATGGRLERSRRHRELRGPHGLEDELRAAFASDSGTWGGIVLMREAGTAHFTAADTRMLASLSPHLADGLRRAVLLSALTAPEEQEADPGLLLLADDDSLEMANSAAQAWLDELGGEAGAPGGRLPFAIRTVADQARNIAAGRVDGGAVASARVPTRSGRWILVRGSMIGDGPGARAAVILEAPRPPELAPLIADAYGLTSRERAVTQLVAHGLPTSEIASRLYLSPYTVQDHLKSVFEKVGVSTRGEVVARLFLEHYAPRLATGARVGSDGWFAPAEPTGASRVAS
jgi:DNA-binding CsgD family transcriptional regulator